MPAEALELRQQRLHVRRRRRRCSRWPRKLSGTALRLHRSSGLWLLRCPRAWLLRPRWSRSGRFWWWSLALVRLDQSPDHPAEQEDQDNDQIGYVLAFHDYLAPFPPLFCAALHLPGLEPDRRGGPCH